MTSERVLDGRLNDHREAVREFVDKASALAESQWLTPRAEGKWTPAQETKHLILTYGAFLSDLAGTPMRLRGTPLKRRLWRWIGLPQILWRQKLPKGVKAPREARPEWECAGPAELIPQLRRRADEFDATLARVSSTEPSRRVIHPMLGPLTLEQAVQLMSVHTRHHAAFLPAPFVGARR
ncbi:MAG: DinB family protein [Gemmatimonadaceae bacterium]